MLALEGRNFYESQESAKIVERVLDRGSGETPSILRLYLAYEPEYLGVTIPNFMSFKKLLALQEKIACRAACRNEMRGSLG